MINTQHEEGFRAANYFLFVLTALGLGIFFNFGTISFINVIYFPNYLLFLVSGLLMFNIANINGKEDQGVCGWI
jgi:hypothetical protein